MRDEMTASLTEEFRQRLAEARRQLFRAVAATGGELSSLEAHPAGGYGDDAATELAATVLSRLEGRDKHELDEIDAARARLEAGTFGACEGCGRAIPLARLRAMPTARFCVSCQPREER